MASELDLDFDESVWNTSRRRVEYKKKTKNPQRVMDLRWKKRSRILLLVAP